MSRLAPVPALALVASAAGCVMPEDINQIRQDIADVQRKIEAANKTQADLQGKVTAIDELGLYRAVGEARASLDAAVRQAHEEMAPIEAPIRDMWRTIQAMPVPDVELPVRFR